MDNYWMFSL